MQSGSAARTASNSATSSLAYVDGIISGATAQGLYSVTVSGNQLNDAMITTLKNYGYTVTTSYNTMGTYPTYTISW